MSILLPHTLLCKLLCKNLFRTRVCYMSRARAFCFTVNNYEGIPVEADWEDLQRAGASYLIFQEEIGEQGTIHLQGYIYFSQTKSLQQVIALIPGGHVLIAKGTAQQNTTYCSKEEGRLGGPYVYGTIPQQVRAKSIASLRALRLAKEKKRAKGRRILTCEFQKKIN